MASGTVNLDAMITRADFATTDSALSNQSSDNFEKIALKDLVGEGAWLPKLLRKPDFQRETTQWTPSQVAILVESFLNGELIPAVILWKSSAHVFVIDGGHRLSALLAWTQDDYGDGPKSHSYFKGELTSAQRKVAAKARAVVQGKVGTFQHLSSQLSATDTSDTSQAARIMNFATRGLQVQWIVGDADKAESSFFKINTQGSVLDPVESRILRNRKKAPAIAARSVVRAATGHRYWSNFDATKQAEISDKSKAVHRALFAPEVNSPVKSIDLPVGGTSSITDALELLMALADKVDNESRTVEKYDDDPTGDETISVLRNLESVTSRLVGTKSKSLGLHPFVYFYTSKGRHYMPLMISMFSLVSEKVKSNDSAWFIKFTKVRAEVEKLLIEHKTIITLLISALPSGGRLGGAKRAITYVIDMAQDETSSFDVDNLAAVLGLESRLYSIQSRPGVNFSDDAKSSAFLREALKIALKCPICGGYMDPAKSASYDHIQKKTEGGLGAADNCQITHPFCNSARDTLTGLPVLIPLGAK